MSVERQGAGGSKACLESGGGGRGAGTRGIGQERDQRRACKAGSLSSVQKLRYLDLILLATVYSPDNLARN